MGRALSERVGRGTCPHCGEAVTYRKSTGGMLKYKCDECQTTGFAEPGGKAYKAMFATIKPDTPDAPPKDSGHAAPEAPVTVKKSNSVFSIGAL